ncbi:MAG: 2-C-methyl-D-erythritol 4-phosphate cytidylyltransferase [Candidatus Diapherotrites archaeon]
MTVFAVVTAGGKGVRMQSAINKSFLPLCGKPMIVHVLEKFEQNPNVDKIVIVIAQDSQAELEELLAHFSFSKFASIALGGKERQDSVNNGVQECKALGGKAEDIVLIHSSCNPLIKQETISACISAAQEVGASIAAMGMKDTVHQVDGEMLVEKIMDRSKLWRAQTPQCAKLGVLDGALQRAFSEHFYGTDEGQLIKRNGGQVKIVDCGFENLKITTPEDLDIAEKILEKRK